MSTTTLLNSGRLAAETPHTINIYDEATISDDVGTASTRHPLGVKPSGNALTATQNARSHIGSFSRLPDTLLLILVEYLDPTSLVALGSSCRALHAYCTYDSLWRDIAVNRMTSDWEWRGSWRQSLRRLPSAQLADIDCSSLFSDALYRPFLCSQVSLSPYVSNIPRQNELLRLEDLSSIEFNEHWVDRPFILTAPVKKWEVFKTWDEGYLLEKYGNIPFICESVHWTLQKYASYMRTTQDESPIYLFDRFFVDKMRLQVGSMESNMHNAYEVPVAFQEDLFTFFGNQRPDHRWLIIGPSRSGSSFHKDPNATSAWNAVIRGSKYWIMFPNSILPPGVYMSEDQSEVTSPLSIAEWLLSFHSEARDTPGCIEGICREGEVLHVPSGWWHLVVNLEPAIAITQNFVPQKHLRSAVHFLKTKPDQISGFKDDVSDPYELFMERLRETRPEIAASIEITDNKKRKWEDVVADQDDASGERQGFSFGFGHDIDEDED